MLYYLDLPAMSFALLIQLRPKNESLIDIATRERVDSQPCIDKTVADTSDIAFLYVYDARDRFL